MNDRLFIRLYLDEDVDVLIALLLRARGYLAITTTEMNLLGAMDERQIEFAAKEQLAILTHNRVDFEQLVLTYHETGRSHAGVIIATRHRPQEIVRRLLILLDSTTADEMIDQVRYI